MEIEYVKSRVEENGIYVDQLFFHDPDGMMIEICNCDNIPVVPLSEDKVWSCSRFNCNIQNRQRQIQQMIPMQSQHKLQSRACSQSSSVLLHYYHLYIMLYVSSSNQIFFMIIKTFLQRFSRLSSSCSTSNAITYLHLSDLRMN